MLAMVATVIHPKYTMKGMRTAHNKHTVPLHGLNYKIDAYQQSKDAHHQHYRKADLMVVPAEDPQAIGDTGEGEQQADCVQGFFVLVGELIDGMQGKQQVNESPNREGDAGWGEQVGVGVGYGACIHAADRQNVGKGVYGNHDQIAQGDKNGNSFHTTSKFIIVCSQSSYW
jgi:hypothetical protein